ncbi:hypothetical protein [Propionivibrio soli]|uniref:hypothetical protein n=1 Tax=Propionivibrio soli TaxID=2976531 RepID=UPI0021E74CCC|nr:hypothetical protein [Propionivibrio soli]
MVPSESPSPLPWVEALRSIGESVARVMQAFSANVLPSVVALAEGIRKLPDELRPMVRSLAERGWFISGEMGMSELRHFQHLSGSSTPEEVDAMLAQWIENEIDRIYATAVQHFPKRQAILAAAFNAHRTGIYELSIPALLIQVEGMCIETLGRKLFATKGGIPRTKEVTDALIDGAFSEVIFLPLREANGFTASNDTRRNWPNSPNRHEILHGISTDYPSKLNSQKAISLLEYFVTFVAAEKAEGPSGTSAA